MKTRALAAALPPLAVLAFELPSSSRGLYFPGVTQSEPACGACHRPTPGADTGFPRIELSVLPDARSLAPGQSIAIAVAVRGGQTASPLGGFAMDASAGTFSAGQNSAVVASGLAVTHATAGTRAWTAGYTAPTTPGPVEVYAVANTVDGDLVNDDDDMWAFHGADDTATQVTPVRLFVNADGVTGFGAGCAGAYGNVPVLGCRQSPALGNANFAFELHGAAPQRATGAMLGVQGHTPGIDLAPFGVPGCALHLDPLITLFGTTSAGDASRGEGTATFPLPVPADPNLLGATLYCQAFVDDPGSGRPAALTLTNALRVTVR